MNSQGLKLAKPVEVLKSLNSRRSQPSGLPAFPSLSRSTLSRSTLYALTFLTAALFLVGCGDSSQTSTSSSTNAGGGSPITAPVDYLNSMAKGKQDAEKTIDTSALNRAIQMFGVDHGRNPNDLNELVQGKYIPKIPDAPYGTKLVYEATTGTVTVQKQ